MSNNRIIEKMKKLLAMSRDSSSEKEAMIATKQLHALLAKHNIEMSELETDEEIGEEKLYKEVNWPWKRTILKSISELYFCKVYIIPIKKNYASYAIVGTEANRSFAGYLIKHIYHVIETSAKLESKSRGNPKGFVASYRNGAAFRISDRCSQLMDDAMEGRMEDSEGNTLPALLDVYESEAIKIEGWLSSNRNLVKGRSSGTRARDSAGYAAGKRKGDSIGLHRGIHEKKSPKLIGNK